MRELHENELNLVSGGEFRLDPTHAAGMEVAIGAAIFAINPILAGGALLAAIMLYGSREDIAAVNEAHSRLVGGGGSGGGKGSGSGLGSGFPNRTGGSKIKSS